jgi:sugar phosphate isomerase/epimerase
MPHPPANKIHQGLGRSEVFDFAAERLSSLRESLALDGRPFSIHSPLCRPRDYPHPAVAVFFLSHAPDRRELSFRQVEETLAEAQRWGADYIVTHLNWQEDSEDRAEAERLAAEAGRRLSDLSARFGIEIHLECGGYAGAFHYAEQFAALASEYPRLGLCLDIGHLWLIAQQRWRSFHRDLEVLAPHARSMHLWNTHDLDHYRRHHHSPLHPSQRPRDGWIDVERVLALVLEENPECRLIFEYHWSPWETEWVREGMVWIASLVAGYRGRGPQLSSLLQPIQKH